MLQYTDQLLIHLLQFFDFQKEKCLDSSNVWSMSRAKPNWGTSIFELIPRPKLTIKKILLKFFFSCFFSLKLLLCSLWFRFSLWQKTFLLKMTGFLRQKLVFFWKYSGKKKKKSEWQKMPIFEPIFDFRAERKRSWAEPSWKSFSSSYGSSQLDSDSSLIISHEIHQNFTVQL